jgi:tetratricopeptide (TPR) repeat protein
MMMGVVAAGLLLYGLLLLFAYDRNQQMQELINSRLQDIAQEEDSVKLAQLAQRLWKAAEKINYEKGMADADFLLGRANKLQGKYDLAITHHLQALQLRRQTQGCDVWCIDFGLAGLGKSYNNLGNIYFQLALYPEALQYYQKALEANQRLGNQEEIAKVYRNIGLAYRNTKEWEKAQFNFQQALGLYKKLNNSEIAGWIYNNLGINQELQLQETGQANYSATLDCYKESLRLNEALQSQQGLGWSYLNVGRMYIKLAKPELALEYLLKAEAIFNEAKDYPNLVYVQTNQGEAYLQAGKATKALESLKRAEQLEPRLVGSEKENIAETYKMLQQVYGHLHNKAKVGLYKEKEHLTTILVAQIRDKGHPEQLNNQRTASKAEAAFALHAFNTVQHETIRKQGLLTLFTGINILLIIGLGALIYQYFRTKKSRLFSKLLLPLCQGAIPQFKNVNIFFTPIINNNTDCMLRKVCL